MSTPQRMHPILRMTIIAFLVGWMSIVGSLFAFMGYVLTDTSLTLVVAFGCVFYTLAILLVPMTAFIARDIWRQ